MSGSQGLLSWKPTRRSGRKKPTARMGRLGMIIGVGPSPSRQVNHKGTDTPRGIGHEKAQESTKSEPGKRLSRQCSDNHDCKPSQLMAVIVSTVSRQWYQAGPARDAALARVVDKFFSNQSPERSSSGLAGRVQNALRAAALG